MSTPNPERFTVGNEHNQVQGADLASAATITPTHKYHYVTGTAAIDTIALPWPNFAGEVVLVPAGAFTWTTAGNIAVAGTAVAGRSLVFHYLPTKGKWYSHAIA